MAAVFEILVTSSVLIVGIFGLRKLTMGKISMRLRYALWLLVAVRLLVPASVGTSPVSVMNLFPAIRQESRLQSVETQALFGQEDGGTKKGKPHTAYTVTAGAGTGLFLQNPTQESTVQTERATSDDGKEQGESARKTGLFGKVRDGLRQGGGILPSVAGGVWLLGVLFVSGYLFVMRFRFVRYLRRNRREVSGEKIPASVRKRLVRRGMRVYRVKGLPSPCLVGRHIYIGEETPGGEQGMLHVLAHEYCHALHGDGFWAFLRCVLAALWWFDPLVWTAAFAARQDSDLACDEAAVRLLGEEERFVYGRTLLDLLQEGTGKAECPGMPLMFSGSARGVRERVVSLTERNKAETVVAAAVISLALFLCGCAFTGAEEPAEKAATAENSAGEQKTEESFFVQERTMLPEVDNEEFARIKEEFDQIQKEYDGYVENGKLTEEQIAELEESARREAEQEAFAEALADYADSGLSEDRQVDVQHFYEYNAGKREDAPEEGWYLLCRDEEDIISCYGLYTEGFGCRGVKMLIGKDVNAFDLVWFPCYMNEDSQNIRVLERTQDGLPRRFVWKYVEEESSVVEIWRLAAGFRYDTGTVDMKVLPKEDYRSWADWHLTFGVDQERGQARVYYDGAANAQVGALDISGYQDFEVEEVRICTYTVAFDLNSKIFGEEAGEDFEGVAIHLAPGLKLEGSEELWSYGLSPITVQLLWDEEKDGGFRFGQPKVDEQLVCHSLVQERELQDIRQGKDPENGRK